MDYDTALGMARTMKEKDAEIHRAIRKCMNAKHGVVALQFSNKGRDLKVVILDESYDENVRVYPG